MQKNFTVRNDELKAIAFALVIIIVMSGFLVYDGKLYTAIFALILSLTLGFRIWKLMLSASNGALSVDETGIWYSKQGKAKTFVVWQNIVSLRRNSWNGQVELLDRDGVTSIAITPSLNHINELQDILLSKSAVTDHIDTSQTTFTKPRHHLFYCCALIVVAALPFIMHVTSPSENRFIIPLLFAGVFMAMIGYAYYITLYQLTINSDSLELHSLFRQKVIPFSRIQSLQLVDFQSITLLTDIQKHPFYLYALGGDTLTLYCCLQHAMEKKRNDHERKTD